MVDLRIVPGQPLDEKQLSVSLGVGLTPVRDALKRLTQERLVVIYPRRGTFASEIRIEDELWLSEVRLGLEGQAAALAAQRATSKECDDLRELAVQLGGDLDAGTLTNIDLELHRAIYAASHNPYLEATANQYANLAMRVWNYGMKRVDGNAVGTGCSLAATVEAIVARDPERASAAAQEHLKDFCQEIRDLLMR